MVDDLHAEGRAATLADFRHDDADGRNAQSREHLHRLRHAALQHIRARRLEFFGRGVLHLGAGLKMYQRRMRREVEVGIVHSVNKNLGSESGMASGFL